MGQLETMRQKDMDFSGKRLRSFNKLLTLTSHSRPSLKRT
jgi:hypothetical protein